MPRYWYDYHANKLAEDASDDEIGRRDLNLRILAEKKPYFMCYIYPVLMSEYNTYIRNTNIKCLREFRIELSDLLEIPEDQRTSEQRDFVRFYENRMPVGMNNCVMNRICKRFEREFDGYFKLHNSGEDFDFSILKSESEYTKMQYHAVSGLYGQYTESLRMEKQMKSKMKFDENSISYQERIKKVFADETLKVCSNSDQLCNIVIDLCYNKSGTKQFAWDICGETIIMNLMKRNKFVISYPIRDINGDITYCGEKFSMTTKRSKYGRDCIE